MKKMKKLVALILAGVMAMALLTACGGGSSSAGNSQMESMIISSVNAARSKGTPELKNDAALRAKCVEALNHIKDGKIQAKYTAQTIYYEDSVSDTGYVQEIDIPTVEDIENYYNKPDALMTPAEMTMESAKEYMADLIEVNSDFDQEFVDSVTAIGVATRVIDGKTYLAVATRYDG